MGRPKGSLNIAKSSVHRAVVLPHTADPGVCYVPLTKGQYATVDASDYEWLSGFNWCAMWMPRQNKFYAVRRGVREDGTFGMILMHRAILKFPSGLTVDHEDRSGLNNRRANLRIATYSQQNCNRIDSRGTSEHKGVSWAKEKGRWRVRIKLNGKTKWLGCFATQEEGAQVYRKASVALHGEFSCTGEDTNGV